MKFLFLFLIATSTIVHADMTSSVTRFFASSKANEKNTTDFSTVELEQKYYKKLKRSRIDRATVKLSKIENEIAALKKKIDQEENDAIKLKLFAELENLEKVFKSAELVFINAATDLNMDDSLKEKELTKSSMVDDVLDMARPAVESLKRLSQRPRKIENIKTEIENLTERKENISTALEKLENELKETHTNSTKELIKNSIIHVKAYFDENQAKLEDLKLKLHKISIDENSLIVEVKKLSFIFLKTKGKNILISFALFLLVMIVLRRGKKQILLGMYHLFIKFNGGDEEQTQWIIRPFSVLYSTLAFILATGAGLGCLYLLNDWILVSAIMLIFAITIWGIKEKIPQFVDQFKLLLNIGPVRESERIIWKGIPWRIKSLGFTCILENKLLEGGVMRIHSMQLLSSQSRPVRKREPWFPTQKGDWVELADGTYGQISIQTPEIVNLSLLGGEIKTYETTSFLSQTPVNLSMGFQLQIDFGFDYGIQDIITAKVNTQLFDYLKSNLDEYLNSQDAGIKNILVEFDNAGASSLVLKVILDVYGDLAGKKQFLKRLINSQIVNFCNVNKYSIPFNQLTVHMHQ